MADNYEDINWSGKLWYFARLDYCRGLKHRVMFSSNEFNDIFFKLISINSTLEAKELLRKWRDDNERRSGMFANVSKSLSS